jgi:hypothetical protein
MYVARHRGPAACLGALRFLAAQGLTPPTLAAPTGGGFTQDMLLADTGIALE